jgi:hypothetical protein
MLDNRPCISGTQYSRQSLLKALLPFHESREWIGDDVMVAVAMFVGCDYVLLKQDMMDAIEVARRNMVTSKIGGLKERQRNNPTAAATVTAILRFIAFYLKASSQQPSSKHSTRNSWLLSVANAAYPGRGETLLQAFSTFHTIYLRPLEPLVCLSRLCYNPVRVDIQRVLDNQIFVGRPIVESWGGKLSSKKLHDLDHKETDSSALCICAITSELAVQKWMAQASLWSMPHFCNIRSRLYTVLGLNDTKVQDDPPQIKEYIRTGTGKSVKMSEKLVNVSPVDSILGVNEEALDASTETEPCFDQAATLFCLMGGDKSLRLTPLLDSAKNYGSLFLASLICPMSHALLLLLMGTAPPSIEAAMDDSLLTLSVSSKREFNQALCYLSVACYHANFVTMGVSMIREHRNGHDSRQTSLPSSSSISQEIRPSQTFRYHVALWIWLQVRHAQGSIPCQTKDLSWTTVYMDATFTSLKASISQYVEHNQYASDSKCVGLMVEWRKAVTPLWSAWCNVFQIGADTSKHN